MAKSRLLTLLHISDLHIGDIDPVSGDNVLDAAALTWWQAHRVFDGYLGHTSRALKHLQDLYLDLPKPVHTIVTGDLTTTGAASQYSTVIAYLEGSLFDPITNTSFGLRLGKAGYTAVPGNHDHWPGAPCTLIRPFTCMLGGPTPAFGATFPVRPITSARISLGKGRTLAIYGLDSDDGVAPHSLTRFAARGSFVGQCGALFAQLGPRPSSELRILLVHHSAIDEDMPAFFLRMNQQSRAALTTLVAQKGIAMVLSGHHHRWDVHLPTGTHDPIREARCGTSTARDYFDENWRVARLQNAIGRSLPRNTALVHHLVEDDLGGIIWETDVRRRRTASGPFELWDTVSFGRVWA